MKYFALLAGALALAGGVAEAQPRVFTLEEIFATAESNSAQLQPYFTAQQEAQRQMAVARSGRLPDVDVSLSVSYIGDGFTTRRDFSDYQKAPIPHLGTGLSLNITQPVYTGGAISGAIDIAEMESTAARYRADLQRDNIRFLLAGNYLDIYKCHNLLDVVRQNVGQAEQVLEEMRARHSQGVALHNDVTRYELLVANLRLQETKLLNSLKILNSSLVINAGLPEGTEVMPDTLMLAALPAKGSERSWQEAATSAPVIQLAGKGVDISRKAEDIVRADYLPHIGIKAGWTMDGPILVEIPPINRNLSYWYIGVGVSYNLSSLFKTDRRFAKSRVATLRARQELDAARDNIELGIRSDYTRYLEAFEELSTQKKSVELADINYRTVALRYNSGMALITDLLDAANAKLDAEQKLVNARIDIIYYHYKLLFTSGKI